MQYFSATVSIVPLLLLGLVLFTACEEEIDTVEDTVMDDQEIEFRTDGTLHFVRDANALVDTLVTIDIEIADTEEARERGLMDREALPDLSGMLFIFPDERHRSFWMADTPLPLDLIFADTDGEIVSITKYARPFSAQSIESRHPARYVVEVISGFTDRYGIMEGDRIRWQRE